MRRYFSHLLERIRHGQGEFVTFRFVEDGSALMVFRRKELTAATREVMTKNDNPAIASGVVVGT